MAEDPSGADFVTISEAAHLLGVSERTVQRRLANVADSDRQMTDTGRVLVRQAALGLTNTTTISDRQTTDKQPFAEGETPSPSDRQPEESDGQPGRQATDSRNELIEQLRSENARLWEALGREQAIAMSATTDARELRVRLLSLEPKAVESDSTNDGPTESSPNGQSGPESNATRPWWRFWGRV